MKTIGIIGGMSWESTALYYAAINRGVAARLGGLHSAKIIMASVDFHEIEVLQAAGNWDAAADILSSVGIQLKKAGADFLIIATNTMHIVADQVEAVSSLPLLHIADATAHAIQKQGYGTVGLLGTAFTMEKYFYKGRLAEKFGLNVLTPDTASRRIVHDVIYNELCQGIVSDSARSAYLLIIDDLQQQGAAAIILGCTEIGMLVKPEHTTVPLLDTTVLHANAAVDFALEG